MLVVMANPEPLSSFIEAAKAARTFVSEFRQDVPLMIASLAICSFMFFAPDSIAPIWLTEWRWAFAAVGVFVGTYFLVALFLVRKPYRLALWHLKHLGADEIEVLKSYLRENRAVRYFPIDHGPACSLVSRGILFAAGMAPYSKMPFAIQPKVLIFLRKHPDLVGMTSDQIGTTNLTDGEEPLPEATFAPENKFYYLGI